MEGNEGLGEVFRDGRALEAAEGVPETFKSALEPAGRASQPVGWASEQAGRASERARRASNLAE